MDKYQKTYNELSKLRYEMDDMEGRKLKIQQELIDIKIQEYLSFIEEELSEGNLQMNNVKRYMTMLAGDVKRIVE